MSVIYYDGDRVALTTIEPQEEPLLRTWINDPEIWSTLGMRRPINEPQEKVHIEKFNANPTDMIFGVYVKDDCKLIGTIGLHRIDATCRRAVLGIMIGDKAYQNNGYGTEAIELVMRYGFMELNLHRILLHVFARNDRAVHVYEKVGFIEEGRLRDHVWRHGQWCDVYVYGILESEWALKYQRKTDTQSLLV